MNNNPDWSALFAYIDFFDTKPDTEWSEGEKLSDGSFVLAYPIYPKEVDQFIDIFYSMDIMDKKYLNTIKNYDIEINHDDFNNRIENADLQLSLAMLTFYIRQERFGDGIIAGVIKDGTLVKILKRLQYIIQNNNS